MNCGEDGLPFGSSMRIRLLAGMIVGKRHQSISRFLRRFFYWRSLRSAN